MEEAGEAKFCKNKRYFCGVWSFFIGYHRTAAPNGPMLISSASDYAMINTNTGKDVTNSDVVVELAK